MEFETKKNDNIVGALRQGRVMHVTRLVRYAD
jgi:hypothetical protein